MNVQCVICKDSIDVLNSKGHGGSNASALPCGHVFHTECITKWFDQSGSTKQGTCPHCRCNVVKTKALRLYLDLVPMENYQDDPVVIRANNDVLRKEIEDLRDTLDTNRKNVDKIKKINSELRERLLEMEKQLPLAEANERMLSLTRVRLNRKTKDLENALEEVEKLRKKLTSIRCSNTILNGNLKDGDEIRDAMENLEKNDLALLVFTYKKDSTKLLKKNAELSSDLSKSQGELRKLQKELAEVVNKNSVLNRVVEVYKPKGEHSSALSPIPKRAPNCVVDQNKPGPSTESSHFQVPATQTVTPTVVTPSRLSIIKSKCFRLPPESSEGRPPQFLGSRLPLPRIGGVSPLDLPIPESYDGLGGHSRRDDFPSKRLKIVTNRKPVAVKRPHP